MMLVTKKGLEKFRKDLETEMNIPLEDVGFCTQKNSDDINDLQHELGEFMEETSVKFYHVEEDVEELKEQMDNLEYYDFEGMQFEISDLQYKVDEEFTEKMEELEERIDDIPSIYDVEDTLENVRESVNDLEWKSDDMEDDIKALKKQNKELMEKVEMLMKVVDTLVVGK